VKRKLAKTNGVSTTEKEKNGEKRKNRAIRKRSLDYSLKGWGGWEEAASLSSYVSKARHHERPRERGKKEKHKRTKLLPGVDRRREQRVSIVSAAKTHCPDSRENALSRNKRERGKHAQKEGIRIVLLSHLSLHETRRQRRC